MRIHSQSEDFFTIDYDEEEVFHFEKAPGKIVRIMGRNLQNRFTLSVGYEKPIGRQLCVLGYLHDEFLK